MQSIANRSQNDILELKYFSVRNITSPEDKQNGRAIYAGQMPIQSVTAIPTNENVREYLAEAPGKKRRALTQVHKAIIDTLKNNPEMFSVLNGGIVIVARDYELDEKNMILRILKPSIIYGSQTEGVIKDFLKKISELPSDIHVKFELIISADIDLIAEISISRNFQNDVQSVSILGRRGVFDELELSLQKILPEKKLQKSETQRSSEESDYLPTEKLIQVIAALLPEALCWRSEGNNKVYTYNRKATCLNDFQEIWKGARDQEHPKHIELKEVYNFYLSMAGVAYELYNKWKTHQGFKGTKIMAIQRDGSGNILEITDGIVFPIIASLSVFAAKENKKWILKLPRHPMDAELIQSAKSAYMEIAKSKPHLMGTTKACYTQLEQLTRIYKNLTQQ